MGNRKGEREKEREKESKKERKKQNKVRNKVRKEERSKKEKKEWTGKLNRNQMKTKKNLFQGEKQGFGVHSNTSKNKPKPNHKNN